MIPILHRIIFYINIISLKKFSRWSFPEQRIPVTTWEHASYFNIVENNFSIITDVRNFPHQSFRLTNTVRCNSQILSP